MGSVALNGYEARAAADNELARGPAILLPVAPGERVRAGVEYFFE
jgi:hypothetical protein